MRPLKEGQRDWPSLSRHYLPAHLNRPLSTLVQRPCCRWDVLCGAAGDGMYSVLPLGCERRDRWGAWVEGWFRLLSVRGGVGAPGAGESSACLAEATPRAHQALCKKRMKQGPPLLHVVGKGSARGREVGPRWTVRAAVLPLGYPNPEATLRGQSRSADLLSRSEPQC